MFSWIHEPASVAWFIFYFDFAVRIWMCSKVIRRKLPAGVAWAWICLILFLPIAGTVLYLFFGEYRQASRRVKRLEESQRVLKMIASRQKKSEPEGEYLELSRAYELMIGFPVLADFNSRTPGGVWAGDIARLLGPLL